MINENIFEGKGFWQIIKINPTMNSSYYTKMNDGHIILSKYMKELGWIVSDTRYNKNQIVEWFDDNYLNID